MDGYECAFVDYHFYLRSDQNTVSELIRPMCCVLY